MNKKFSIRKFRHNLITQIQCLGKKIDELYPFFKNIILFKYNQEKIVKIYIKLFSKP